MKRTLKVYLEPEQIKSLMVKAQDVGFVGRAWLTKYIKKISQEPIVFLDNNMKTLLSVLQKR